jgi:predicted amidohydrolase YtcJ
MIAVGRAADLVVLNGDPLTCDIDLLPQLKADLTMLDGRITHDALIAKKAVSKPEPVHG